MSENRFKVQAKKPASASADPKAESRKKLEQARVKKSAVLPRKELPDVRDMGSMTREERINAVLGKKPAARTGAAAGEKKARSERYGQMKKDIAQAKAREKKTAEKPAAAPVRKDWTGFVLKLSLIALALVLAAIVIILVLRRSGSEEEAGPVLSESIEITVPAGSTASEAAAILSPWFDGSAFLSQLEAEGLSSSVRAGEYTLSPDMSIEELVRTMTAPPDQDGLTIWPGYTVSDIDRMLANRGLAASGDFTRACEKVRKELGLDFIEGWLLAGEYAFQDCGSLALSMVSSMLALLRQNAAQAAASGLSLNDIVIIASMINRETQAADQMSTIAAVILNRLHAGMPLGIDSTTRYELNDWSISLPQSAFERPSDYNTRRKAGLPPTGIGCPGRDAVLAVLFPDDTSALYYLHDEEGRLYTSSTYEEHLAAYESVH